MVKSKAENYRLQEANQIREEKIPYWKPSVGVNKIRILPAFNPAFDAAQPISATNPYVPVAFDHEDATSYAHRVVESAWVDDFRVITQSQFGGPAGLLERYHDELIARGERGDAASAERASEIAFGHRFYYWIIDRADEAKGPQLWETTLQNGQAILLIMMHPDYGGIDLPMPVRNAAGHDIGAIDLVVTYIPKDRSPAATAQYLIQAERFSKALGTAEQMAEWLSDDLWEKYEPFTLTDGGFAQAVIGGSGEQFLAECRASRDRLELEDPESLATDPTPDASVPPPVPIAPWLPKVLLPVGVTGDSRFWSTTGDGAPISLTADDIAGLIIDGQDPEITKYDLSSSWMLASEAGFVVQAPSVPPPPSPTPPFPLPPSPWHELASAALAVRDLPFEEGGER